MSCTCGTCEKDEGVEGLLREILAEMREMNANRVVRPDTLQLPRISAMHVAGETDPEDCHPLRQHTPGRPDENESYGEAE